MSKEETRERGAYAFLSHEPVTTKDHSEEVCSFAPIDLGDWTKQGDIYWGMEVRIEASPPFLFLAKKSSAGH